MSIGEIFMQLYLIIIGLSVGVGSYIFLLYRNSWRWRQLAKVYTASPLDQPIKQRWTNMILHGAGAWNCYAGVTLVGVNQNGVTLKILPPFSFGHCPLFFPNEAMNFVPTRWLFQDAYQIRLRHDMDLRIVINKSTVRWVENQRAEFEQRHSFS